MIINYKDVLHPALPCTANTPVAREHRQYFFPHLYLKTNKYRRPAASAVDIHQPTMKNVYNTVGICKFSIHL